MATRRRTTTQPTTPPNLAPENALPLFQKQLERLLPLKGRNHNDAEADEDKWEKRTHSIVVRTFGDPSVQLSQFYDARNAGDHNIMGVSEAQAQRNFELRITRFEAFLDNVIEELTLELPEGSRESVYQPGDVFKFYRDLAEKIGKATKEVFLIDPYLDEEHFSLYLGRLDDDVSVRVLVNLGKSKGSLDAVAKKFKTGHNDFELRSSKSIHDRLVFVDDRAWFTGQSVKDAAATKPTYIIESHGPEQLRKAYEPIWSAAHLVV